MKTLYIKFVVITIGIILLSGLLSFFISNVYYQTVLKDENDAKNTEIASHMASFIEGHPKMNIDDYFRNVAEMGYQIYLIDDVGDETFYGAEFRHEDLSDEAKQKVESGEIFHGMAQYPTQTFVTGFFANELENTIGVQVKRDGQIYAMFMRPNIKMLFNEMHILFGWIFGLTILFSIILVIFYTKYLVGPITKLTKATKSVANGDFAVNINMKRHDELGELSQSFARMAGQLEHVDDRRKEFVSNISHDIQSPLSNIKGYADILRDETLSKSERGQYGEIIDSEIDRLTSLTKQLLMLASIEDEEKAIHKESFNLGEQLRALIQHYRFQISEKGLMLEHDIADVWIYADYTLIYTVWENLLTNAMKYNRDNGEINISLEIMRKSVRVSFRDSGIGVSDVEKERIFERFYRVDQARSRAIKGTGLGLSIVTSIINLHKGEIDIQSSSEGTTFTVDIPLHED